MLGIAGVNALDEYKEKIVKLAKDYGSQTWILLYQAEVRMRREEMPDMRRELIRESEAVKKAGGRHPYDPAQPWKLVWEMATSKDSNEFWTDEFITPATLVRLHLKEMGEVVDGDAPIGYPDSIGEQNLTYWAAGGENNHDKLPEPAPRKRLLALTTEPHAEEETYLIAMNKRRKKLCKAFQRGACEHTKKGDIICPDNKEERHQCAGCLGDHPFCECDGSGPLGKGRGAGKGGKNGNKGKNKGAGRGGKPWKKW